MQDRGKTKESKEIDEGFADVKAGREKPIEKVAKELGYDLDELSKQKKRDELLKEMNKMFAKSKLTEKDAIELGRKVNKSMAKRREWKD